MDPATLALIGDAPIIENPEFNPEWENDLADGSGEDVG